MVPTYAPGEAILVDRQAYGRRSPRAGDVVLAQHPFKPAVQMVKRVARVTESGRFFLQGDNPDSLESTDSRSFGPLQRDSILGRVVGSAERA